MMRVWLAEHGALMEMHAGAGHVACMMCEACRTNGNACRCGARCLYDRKYTFCIVAS